MDPVTEGTTLTLVCPPHYVLIGHNTTTCMGNGKWEPDPRMVECNLKGKLIKVLIFVCMHPGTTSYINIETLGGGQQTKSRPE